MVSVLFAAMVVYYALGSVGQPPTLLRGECVNGYEYLGKSVIYDGFGNKIKCVSN